MTHDDYKLVRIARRSGDACFGGAAEVKVYSVAKNSWKRIQDIPPCYIPRDSTGVYASGSLHWIAMAEYGRHDFILALDLSDEAYKELPLPPPVLLAFVPIISVCWIMAVCAWFLIYLKDSWTKLFSISEEQVISPSPEFYDYSLPFESLEPLAFYEGGTQLLLAHNKINFLVYDLNTNQATVRWPEPEVAPMPGVFYMCLQS